MLRRLLARFQGAILARPIRVLVGSGVLVAVAIVLAAGVEFRTSRSDLAPPGDPDQQRLDRLMQGTGGSAMLIVCVERLDDEQTGAADLRGFADVLVRELERDPLVGSVFYKVPLDWFLERALYLVPSDALRAAVDQADRQQGALGALATLGNLAALNEEIASGLEAGVESGSDPPPDAGRGLSYIVRLLEAQHGFAEDPRRFVEELESRPPLLALGGERRAVEGEGYVATQDGTKLFLFVSPATDRDDLPTLRRFISTLRSRAESVTAGRPEFKVAFTGQPAMTVEEMDTVRRDTWFTSLVAVVGVTVLTLLVFRWRTHVFLVLCALAAGVIWAFGAVRLELGYLNLITSSFISTLVGLGVAYSIHPVSEYELEGAHTRDAVEAVREAYHRVGAPVTVAAVTTSAAFLSILLMQFRGFAELGVVAGIGVLLCLAASLVTLPALLVVYGRRRHRRDRAAREGAASAAVDRFWVERGATQVCRYPKTVTTLALLATAGLGLSARDIDFNTNLLDLLPHNSEALEYQRRMIVESELSPVFSVVVAEKLDALREMERRANAEPTIRRFESVLQFIPEDPAGSQEAARRLAALLEKVTLPDRPTPLRRATYEASLVRLEASLADASEDAFGAGLGELAGPLEEAREVAERTAAVVAGAPESAEVVWNDGQRRLLEWARELLRDLRRAAAAEPPELKDLPAEIRDRFVTLSGEFLGFLQPRDSVFDPEPLASYVAASKRVSPEATGFPILFHRTSQRITAGFYRAVAAGSILVVLILLVDYRNLRDTALAVLPLVLGVIWMLGFMGLLGLSFNFANLVAVPLIIGVGIDNGVHVVHRVRLEGREGMTVVLRHTGRAILIASLTTMIGFGSLGLASHRGLASLGVVLFLGVGSCLVTSTIVLPNILVSIGKARR